MTDLTGNVCAVVTTEVLQKVLKNDYGFINGEVQQLDGYDDKNFRITVSIHDLELNFKLYKN